MISTRKLSYCSKYYARNRERILARLQRKYRKDAKFRKAVREAAKRRYHENPEYRKAVIERAKERYRRLKTQTSGT